MKINKRELTSVFKLLSISMVPDKRISTYMKVEKGKTDNQIVFSVTDFSTYTVFSVPGQIEEDSFCIDYTALKSITSVLPDSDIEFKIEKNAIAHINSIQANDKAKFSLNILPTDSFPAEPTIEGTGIQINTENFCNALLKMFSTFNTYNVNPALSGIFIKTKDNKMTLVSTDSRTMTVNNIPIDTDFEMEIILPHKAAEQIIKTSNPEDCVLYLNENKLVYCAGDYKMYFNAIDANYPNYEQVIPKQFKADIVINREEFLTAIKRVMIIEKNSVSRIVLYIREKNIEIFCQTEKGNSKAVINCSGNCDLDIAFNGKFLIDCLKDFSSEKINLKLNDKELPGMLTDNTDHIKIIMPLKLD